MSRWKSRVSAVLVGTAALVVLCAVPAAAHVTVNPDTAEQGDYTKLTFRVPTERDNASTTKLEVTLPEEHPLSSVSVKSHPGWDYEVTTEKLDQPVDQGEGREPLTEAVRTITWTADDKAAAIKPGEFDEFDVSVGPLPENADEMIFKAVQTYDSGEVVRWIEVAADGAEERPEHPAPILNLTAPADTEQQAAPAAAETETDQSGSVTTALVLSIIALVLGGAGLATGLLARRRS